MTLIITLIIIMSDNDNDNDHSYYYTISNTYSVMPVIVLYILVISAGSFFISFPTSHGQNATQ